MLLLQNGLLVINNSFDLNDIEKINQNNVFSISYK